MSGPFNEVFVQVTITPGPGDTYNWGFTSEYEGFDPKTGKVTLQEDGPTQIIYDLLSPEFNLIYVNLDAYVCATREIHKVDIDTVQNRIVLHDANAAGRTGQQPFSLRLIARPKGDVNTAIISPDPEVENDPPPRGP
jgi:hypothetical protein